MAYQVIARKFRPQSFTDFVGQSHVTQTLLNALAADRFPHALLLTGPRGTGKTTTARIIAKTLLCENPQNQHPCGQCRSCQDIADGNHLDVIEIDGASNNGVDHIRELRDTIGYMPSSGKYKVYIIDEVHMLSTSAFNALLKTLEEPPEHVIFIFATTEVQKIPATILSRCQRFDFRNHTLIDIKNNLQKICESDNIQFEDSALLMIAKQANGSIRDSLTLLDQLISFSHGELTLQSVMNVLGLTDRNLLLSCLKAIALNDSELMYQTVRQFKNSGYDPKLFAEEFLEVIRNSLMVLKGCYDQNSLDISEYEISELKDIVENLSEEMIHLLFDVMLSGTQRLNFNSDARLGLEMLLFKLLSLPRLTQSLPSVPKNPKNGSKVKKNTESTIESQSKEKTQATLPDDKAIDKEETLEATNIKTEVDESSESKELSPSEEKTTSIPVPFPDDEHKVGKTWDEFVNAVKQANGFLGALLEHTSLVKEDSEALHLGLPSKMRFLYDKLAEQKNIERTENFLKNFWNDQRQVYVEILEKDHLHENLSPKAIESKVKEQKAKQVAESIESHPLVQATEKVFKDHITKVGVIDIKTPQQEI